MDVTQPEIASERANEKAFVICQGWFTIRQGTSDFTAHRLYSCIALATCTSGYHTILHTGQQSIYLRVYSLHHNVLPTLLYIPYWPMGFFTRSHRFSPATASIQCLEAHDHFQWPVPHSCVLHECLCVAVAESVRSGSVESGIYYSDHWWLQAYL